MIERFIIQEGLYDPGIFKAFFLAGGPGSGKSYVTKRITGGLGLKNVNSDNAFERSLKKAGLSLDMPPEEEYFRDKMRAKSKALTGKGLDLYIQSRLGLVIDSTARDISKIETGLAALKRLGYDCHMVFVNTSLEVALARNASRDRTVPIDIAKKSHAQIQRNMGKLQMLFGMKNFYVVDNNKANDDVLAKAYKMVSRIVKKPITNHVAKMWMRKELEKKQAAFEARNYTQEYERYHKRPEQIARRSSRNKARRAMGDKAVKGLDVGHKDNDPMNNDPDNLRNEDPTINRREPRFRDRAIEDINVPIKVGDVVKGGKFKNKPIKVKKIGKNDKGDITINDKPILRVRISNENA